MEANFYFARYCWASLIFLFCISARADIVVVGHLDAPMLERYQVEQIFLAKTKEFPNGKRVQPIDLPEGEELRDIFYQQLANRSQKQLKAYWARMIFTGSGKPPEKLDDTDEVLEAIEDNPDAVGYLREEDVTESVKVLYSLAGQGS